MTLSSFLVEGACLQHQASLHTPRDTVRVFAAARASAECAFALSLAAGAVRVCVFVRPSRPPMPRLLSQCPQLSTSVRDHRGRSFVPAKWAVLPSVQFQPKPPGLAWRFGWHILPQIPCSDCRARSVELCTGALMTHAEGQRKREGPFP